MQSQSSAEERWTPYTDPTYRLNQYSFHDWPAGNYYQFIDKDNVREQENDIKAHLFRRVIDQNQVSQEKGRRTLQALAGLHADAASYFEVKSSVVNDVTFRLHNGESADTPEAYIALSYRWPEATIEAASENLIRMPLDPILFQHFVAERKSATEGLWCDQLCINQKDEEERSHTVGAMDLIYKSARLVVVALTDITVTMQERLFLEDFVKDYTDPKWPPTQPPHIHDAPPFMAEQPILFAFFLKVVGSEYFTRAWCSHELRLGQAHLFIMKCESFSSDKATVCSITGAFLGYLALLGSRVSKPHALYKTIATLYRIFDWNEAINRIYRPHLSQDVPSGNGQHTGLYPPLIQEVFVLCASGNPHAIDRERDANLDRMTILLNSVDAGISLNRTISSMSRRTESSHRCTELLLLVALAAGDPTSLCTMGKPLEFEGPMQSSSWLCKPHFADLGLGSDRLEALPRMADFRCQVDNGHLAEWISLDVLALGTPERMAESSVETASQIIIKCVELGYGGGLLGLGQSGPQYPNWRAQWDHPQLTNLFHLTVAAILDLGPQWMLGMASKCGFDDASVTKDLQTAISTHFTDGFDQNYLDGLSWTQDSGASNAVNWILKTANFMVALLGTYLTVDERQHCMPYLFSRGWSRRVLVFARSDARIVCVVPVALLRAEYTKLPRVWLLQATGDSWGQKTGDHNDNDDDDDLARERSRQQRLFIRSKSVLFGHISTDDYQAQAQSPNVGRDLRIHGRIDVVDPWSGKE